MEEHKQTEKNRLSEAQFLLRYYKQNFYGNKNLLKPSTKHPLSIVMWSIFLQMRKHSTFHGTLLYSSIFMKWKTLEPTKSHPSASTTTGVNAIFRQHGQWEAQERPLGPLACICITCLSCLSMIILGLWPTDKW